MRRFRHFRPLMLMAGVSLATMIPEAASASRSALECDRLTAHPFDPARPVGVPGVSNSNVDYYQAIQVCDAALRDYPQNARLKYQYGRALHLSGRSYESLKYMVEAARGGYAIAKFSVGNIHYTGADGLPISKRIAFGWYRDAAADGVEMAQVYAARMLDKGEGVDADRQLAEVYWRELKAKGNREAIARMRTASDVGRAPPPAFTTPPVIAKAAEPAAPATAASPPASGGTWAGVKVAAGVALSGVCYYFETCWSYFGDATKEIAKEGVRQTIQEVMREKPKP